MDIGYSHNLFNFFRFVSRFLDSYSTLFTVYFGLLTIILCTTLLGLNAVCFEFGVKFRLKWAHGWIRRWWMIIIDNFSGTPYGSYWLFTLIHMLNYHNDLYFCAVHFWRWNHDQIWGNSFGNWQMQVERIPNWNTKVAAAGASCCSRTDIFGRIYECTLHSPIYERGE